MSQLILQDSRVITSLRFLKRLFLLTFCPVSANLRGSYRVMMVPAWERMT